MEVHHAVLPQLHKQLPAHILIKPLVMPAVDVLGLMLVLVLLSQNVQITQLPQQPMQINVILKTKHVSQEQHQEHQFHAQLEQPLAQVLQTKQFAHQD